MIQFNDIELFRITHIENILHILKYGITHRDSKNANKSYKNIGDVSLIASRENKKVDITNGGSSVIKTITIGDFVPFYFGVKMPMLYVIQHGGNFVEEARKAEDIVYIVCNLEKIINLNQEYYFSDGHAMDIFTTFYDSTFINHIQNILDWNAINIQYWGGIENLEIKRKKQAEFLIRGDLPPNVIGRFVCYNEKAKIRLNNFGVNSQKIEIDEAAYY